MAEPIEKLDDGTWINLRWVHSAINHGTPEVPMLRVFSAVPLAYEDNGTYSSLPVVTYTGKAAEKMMHRLNAEVREHTGVWPAEADSGFRPMPVVEPRVEPEGEKVADDDMSF